MARLTVIVPATDAPATLPQCQASIAAAAAAGDEVIVVDEPVALARPRPGISGPTALNLT